MSLFRYFVLALMLVIPFPLPITPTFTNIYIFIISCLIHTLPSIDSGDLKMLLWVSYYSFLAYLNDCHLFFYSPQDFSIYSYLNAPFNAFFFFFLDFLSASVSFGIIFSFSGNLNSVRSSNFFFFPVTLPASFLASRRKNILTVALEFCFLNFI